MSQYLQTLRRRDRASEVDFDLLAGEVHGLVAKMAGKSTMMKLLAGVFDDYSGELILHGQPVRFASPADAQAQGIGMVYQELSTFQHLTVAENLFSRQPPTRGGILQWRRMNRRRKVCCKNWGRHRRDQPHGRVVGRFAAACGMRAIFSGQHYHLDEPTSALSAPETPSF
ncbi:MAG: ATP-binding cassette domain-containing protein [Caldilineaceae bacterium]